MQGWCFTVTEKHHNNGPEATSTQLSVPTEGQASPDLSSDHAVCTCIGQGPSCAPALRDSAVTPSSHFTGEQPGRGPRRHPGPLPAVGRPVLPALPFSSVGLFNCGGHFGLAGSTEESTAPARVLESCVCLGPHSLTGVCRKSPPPPLLPKLKGPSRKAEPTGLVTG